MKNPEHYLKRLEFHYSTNMQGYFATGAQGNIRHEKAGFKPGKKFYRVYYRLIGYLAKYMEVMAYRTKAYNREQELVTVLIIVGYDSDVEMFFEYLYNLYDRIEAYLEQEKKEAQAEKRRKRQKVRSSKKNQVEPLINITRSRLDGHLQAAQVKYRESIIEKTVLLLINLLERKETLPRPVDLKTKMGAINQYIKNSLSRGNKKRIYARYTTK